MSRHTLNLTDDLYLYSLSIGLREHPVLTRLREATESHPMAKMQISPDQGQFMAFLVRLTGARRILEIGTFTGYSALAMALALPDSGRLMACEIDPDYARIALDYWGRAQVAHKIELRLAPAAETLSRLLSEGAADTFDLCFVDADKQNYDTYYELGLKLLRPGGLMLVDNILRGGDSANPATTSLGTQAIRALNTRMHGDSRVELSFVPIGDGLMFAQKRPASSGLQTTPVSTASG